MAGGPTAGVLSGGSAGGRTPLLERELELDAIDAVLAAARRRRGALLLFEGSAGVGKSRLLTAAADRARGQEMRVLRACGDPVAREVSFGVTGQLFGPLLAGAGEAQRRQLLRGQAAHAASLFGLAPPQAVAGGSPALMRGLFWLAGNLVWPERGGAPAPLVLIVDDAQWCDRPSLAFLAHMAARLDDLATAILLAVRTGEPAAAEDQLAALRGERSARLVRPAPLSDAAVAGLVQDAYDGGAAVSFCAACARASGGNPFLLRALIEGLRAEGVPASAESAGRIAERAPAEALRTVAQRLGRLDAAAVALARAVATLGDGALPARAAALAELAPEQAELAAAALAGAQIFAPGVAPAFVHPLIAAAVDADRTEADRALAHRRAAELLEADGAPPERVAAHLARARPQTDDWAVQRLRTGASVALQRGDAGAAVRFLRCALGEPELDRDGAPEAGGVPTPAAVPSAATPATGAAGARAALLVELAGAEAADGRAAAVGRLQAALDQIADPVARAGALASLARLLFVQGRYGAAAELADQGLGEVDACEPVAERLLAGFLAAAGFDAGWRPRAFERSGPIVAAALEGRLPREPGLCALVALALAEIFAPRETILAAVAAALRADPLVERGGDGVALACVGATLFEIDAFAEAERAMAEALQVGQRRGATIAVAMASHWRATLHFHRGRLGDAVADAERALAAFGEGFTGLIGWPVALLAQARIERGELGAARGALALVDPQSIPGFERSLLIEARARLALVDGDPAAALAGYEASGGHLATFHFTHPGMYFWRRGAAIAAQRLGDRDRAQEHAGAALAQARKLAFPRTLAASLRCAGTIAGDDQGLALLAEAVEVADRSPSGLEQLRTRLELGAALRRERRAAAAQVPLRDALELAERFGAAPLAGAARDELRAAGAQPQRPQSSGADTLTPAERRVAELAAAGMSDLEIAQELYVTPKLVEAHLTRGYRKLGVDSRRRLAAALGS